LVNKLSPAPSNLSWFKTMKPPLRPDEAFYMIRGESAWGPLVNGAIWDSTAVPERWKDQTVGFRCVKDAP
jgi:hypothetical protein